MKLRSTAVTAAVSAAAALAATGITYASAASTPAAAPHAAPAVAAALPDGGNGNGDDNSKGDEGGKGNEGRGGGGHRYYEGRIEINERSYSAYPGDCITVVSGLGARTLNVRNDTKRTVEVFRGAVCDNGAPIATVGPRSSSDGVHPGRTHAIHIKHGVVASFRVVRDFHDGGRGDW